MMRYSFQSRGQIFVKGYGFLSFAGGFFANIKSNGITKFSKISEQNNSEIVTNKHDKEIPKEKYVSLKYY